MPARMTRFALIGTACWLFPVLAYVVGSVAWPEPVALATWGRTALTVLTLGLGIWVLLLVVLYRGRLPFCSSVVGAAFVMINLSTDVVLIGPTGSGALRGYLVDVAPSYMLLGGLCAGLGWLAAKRVERLTHEAPSTTPP